MATFEGSFEPTAASVPRARMLARASHAHLPPGMLARLELVVSELATNAVVHACTAFELRLTLGTVIRVEVIDGSRAAPVLQPSSPRELSGRGLRLVAACADRWGWERIVTGKVVWAELGPGAPTPTHDSPRGG